MLDPTATYLLVRLNTGLLLPAAFAVVSKRNMASPAVIAAVLVAPLLSEFVSPQYLRGLFMQQDVPYGGDPVLLATELSGNAMIAVLLAIAAAAMVRTLPRQGDSGDIMRPARVADPEWLWLAGVSALGAIAIAGQAFGLARSDYDVSALYWSYAQYAYAGGLVLGVVASGRGMDSPLPVVAAALGAGALALSVGLFLEGADRPAAMLVAHALLASWQVPFYAFVLDRWPRQALPVAILVAADVAGWFALRTISTSVLPIEETAFAVTGIGIAAALGAAVLLMTYAIRVRPR